MAFSQPNHSVVITSDILEKVILQPLMETFITMDARALSEGRCSIEAVTYRFNGLQQCREVLTRSGPRLNVTKAQQTVPTYDVDKSLMVTVTPASAVLSVTVPTFPNVLYHGEVATSSLRLENIGDRSMRNLRVLPSHPNFVTIIDQGEQHLGGFRLWSDAWTNGAAYQGAQVIQQNGLLTLSNSLIHTKPTVIAHHLLPSETMDLAVIYRGASLGSHTLSWLFVFEDEVGYFPQILSQS